MTDATKQHEGTLEDSGVNCDNGDCWCWEEHQAAPVAPVSSNERCPHGIGLTSNPPCHFCKHAQDIKQLQDSLRANIAVSKSRYYEIERLRAALHKERQRYMTLADRKAKRGKDEEAQEFWEKAEAIEKVLKSGDSPAPETTKKPARPFAWYRQCTDGDFFARGDWPPGEPDDITWQPLYLMPGVSTAMRRVADDIFAHAVPSSVQANCVLVPRELIGKLRLVVDGSVEETSASRKTRYCDYDLCPHTFDPAHSNNDH